ncbi:MAG: hypothetical protein HQK51_17435 [Oligoflexia bacterium]|nr:hypothetical protein [Oligoflexia bacterium]
MLETIKLIFTHFNDETIIVLNLALLIVLSLIVSYWLYNKKKFHQLTHQIPADVVKNYLDSIIQNSTALKSSLFRGGGLDLGAGIPSVVPISGLEGKGVASDVSSELLHQKNAEIASLNGTLAEKISIIRELEGKLTNFKGDGSNQDNEVKKLRTKISELENEVQRLENALKEAKAAAAAGTGNNSNAQIEELSKERDELKGRLQEYEIIEDDLANLKKLQQENEELKKQLAGKGGETSKASAPTSPSPPKQEEKPAPSPAPAVAAAAATAAATEIAPAAGGEEKSAEDLLSEFEKMLG